MPVGPPLVGDADQGRQGHEQEQADHGHHRGQCFTLRRIHGHHCPARHPLPGVAVLPHTLDLLPTARQTGAMLRNVAAVLLDGVNPFELGVVCEVFGVDRSDDGLPVYDFAVASADGPAVRTINGFSLQVAHGLERLETADLIAVPAGAAYTSREFPPGMLDALRRGVDRGARVLSVCSGVFVLAAAGLLDGRRAAAHWKHAEELTRQYPHLTVEPDVLYVDEDPVITSAGTAAGIDACLHLVRKEQGP
ncbi:AraC family transcriptional regulator, partial [Streptomyces griseoflavus Tu4000]